MRLEIVDLLSQQKRIGAQDHKLLAGEVAFDNRRHLAMQQRLAAGDRDHRRAAFVDGAERVLDRHALIEDLVGIVDLAAARTSEVAAKQRLEHQHQWIALAPAKALAHHIATDSQLLPKRYSHDHRPC